MDEEENKPVLHVLVVGFHPKKGCQIEYAYPALLPGGSCRSSELPSQWRHLPSLALPDGSHNYESDTAFFHLADLEDPRKTVFGISCFRQVDASRVVNKSTEDITRGTVQKSVCVVSRLPLYGHIQVKMALITEAFFREGDFQRVDLIHQTYDNLNACLSDDLVRTQQLYVGLSARKFVRTFAQRCLVLFKLLLLEKKVLLFQSPVIDLCGFLLTLLSLHPGMLENGLHESACVVPPDSPCSSSAQEEEPIVVVEAEEEKYSLSSICSISNQDLGLPLAVFGAGNLCHPYLSLSYIDMLVQPSVRGYIIGATNVLFKQKKGMAQVVVDIEKDKLDILEPELKKALQLTTEDLRFADNLVKMVWEDSSDSKQHPDVFLDGVGWEGGDEWVRAQFRLYLVCLMRTSLVQEDGTGEVARFNTCFVDMWKSTRNYKDWVARCNLDLFKKLPPEHPFAAGHLSVTDVKLHLSNTITNTESGKRVSQAVVNTGKAVAGGLSSAKGAFSSWMSSLKQQQQQTLPAEKTNDDDDKDEEEQA